jgi:RND family efflux transporter MFP subunit
MTRRTWAIAVLLLAASACRHQESYEKPKLPVRIEAVSAAGAEGGIRYAAALEPNVRVDLAFKVPGYVGELARVDGRTIQEGDRVTAGMVLASIRPDDVQAKLAQAQSQQQEAEAGMRQAEDAYTRAKALFEAKSLTKPDLEAARGAYESVQAKMAGARALVREAQNAVHDSALRAPIDGLVLKRLVEVGSLVGAGTPGFVLAQTSPVKVVFGVPDVMLPKVRAHGELAVTLEAFPGQVFTGHVVRISPVADLKTRNFDVEVQIPNPHGELKVGMVASLQMAAESGTAPVLAIPLSAVVRSPRTPDGYAVAVVVGDGDQARAQIRDVTLGDMVGNRVAVTSGLRPGDRITRPRPTSSPIRTTRRAISPSTTTSRGCC